METNQKCYVVMYKEDAGDYYEVPTMQRIYRTFHEADAYIDKARSDIQRRWHEECIECERDYKPEEAREHIYLIEKPLY